MVVVVAGLDFTAADPTPKGTVLAIIEMFTIAAALLLVVMMAAVFEFAAPRYKTHGLVAFGLVLLLAGVTCCISFASLATFGQGQAWPAEMPPTVSAANWFVWDVFLGLALLCCAPVFRGKGLPRAARVLLRVAGIMCIIGTIGPASGRLQLQSIAGTGYVLVFPAACLLIGLIWRRGGMDLSAQAQGKLPLPAEADACQGGGV